MALEQVNVQELQRLGDAINMTMEAIRRVAPQLALLQQQGNPYVNPLGLGFGAPLWGQPQTTWQPQFGQPQFGQQLYPQAQPVPQIDPITAAYLQGHIQGVRSAVTHIGLGVGASPGLGAYTPQTTFGGQPYGFMGVPGQQATPFVTVQRPF
jgi:hypothetical protein